MNDPISSPGTEEEKQALRKAMRRRLAALGAEDRQSASRRIVARLVGSPEWRRARSVALFAPMAREPDLDILWNDEHLTGKACVYPVVRGRDLRLYHVGSLEDLRPVPPWNLREPDVGASARCTLAEVDLVLVPGLAFDSGGGRLGRGGGYYDRLLAGHESTRPVTLGVGFDFQELDRLPLAAHDVRLHRVLCV